MTGSSSHVGSVAIINGKKMSHNMDVASEIDSTSSALHSLNSGLTSGLLTSVQVNDDQGVETVPGNAEDMLLPRVGANKVDGHPCVAAGVMRCSHTSKCLINYVKL